MFQPPLFMIYLFISASSLYFPFPLFYSPRQANITKNHQRRALLQRSYRSILTTPFLNNNCSCKKKKRTFSSFMTGTRLCSVVCKKKSYIYTIDQIKLAKNISLSGFLFSFLFYNMQCLYTTFYAQQKYIMIA